MSMFYRTLLVLLSFLFWSLCYLYFLDLRILITLLVSSNASFITVWYKLIIGVKFKVNVKKLGSYFYLKFCEKYIKGMQSAKFGLLLDRRLSIHMTGRLKVLYSVLFVFGQFCINSAS